MMTGRRPVWKHNVVWFAQPQQSEPHREFSPLRPVSALERDTTRGSSRRRAVTDGAKLCQKDASVADAQYYPYSAQTGKALWEADESTSICKRARDFTVLAVRNVGARTQRDRFTLLIDGRSLMYRII